MIRRRGELPLPCPHDNTLPANSQGSIANVAVTLRNTTYLRDFHCYVHPNILQTNRLFEKQAVLFALSVKGVNFSGTLAQNAGDILAQGIERTFGSVDQPLLRRSGAL